MKRKDSEVYDEFMDFSLSSPPRKIRRLDASELPPTMELAELGICSRGLTSRSFRRYFRPLERIDFSFRKESSARCVFADYVLNPRNQRFRAEDEESEADSCSLAIVPWAPSQAAMPSSGWFAGSELQSQSMLNPMMEGDAEDASMQVEDTRHASGYSEGDEGCRQVPQHCMTPQFLPNPNTSSPSSTMGSL